MDYKISEQPNQHQHQEQVQLTFTTKPSQFIYYSTLFPVLQFFFCTSARFFRIGIIDLKVQQFHLVTPYQVIIF